jgi:hypothetical protein
MLGDERMRKWGEGGHRCIRKHRSLSFTGTRVPGQRNAAYASNENFGAYSTDLKEGSLLGEEKKRILRF